MQTYIKHNYLISQEERQLRDGWVTLSRFGVDLNAILHADAPELDPSAWDDFRHYTINLLTVTTGMRMGEIRGLCVENVKPSHVEIRHSWEQGYGLKPPKYDSVRDVPVTAKVSGALGRVIRETMPRTILFYGDAGPDLPISKSAIEKKLYAALERVGITEIERRHRRITFHSHRHFLNILLRSKGVSDTKVREITGHRSIAMSQHYTHFRVDDFAEVVDVQEQLLGVTA